MKTEKVTALQRNADQLIEEWAHLVKTSTEHYTKLPHTTAKKVIKHHFEALLDVFKDNNYKKLNDFLVELARIRERMGFSLRETQMAFLHGQTVLLKFLDHLHENDKNFCDECREITDCFYKTQVMYSNIYMDIQYEKATDTYIREIEHKDIHLSSLTYGTADAVIGLDEKLLISSWNLGAEEMYQYKPDEIIGRPIEVLIPKDLRSSGEPQSLKLLVNEKGFIKDFHTERLRKDGKRLYVTMNFSQLKDAEGNLIGYTTIHHNRTETVELEQEIRSQQKYLSSIVDNSVDAIIGLDLNDRIVSWNKGAENIFGYSKKEAIGKSFNILLPADMVGSQEAQQINDELHKIGFIKNYEWEQCTKNGKRITTALTRSLIKDKKNKIIGSSSIIRDITEYKKLKMQMSHSEKLTVVGQLAAGIAHEVGNPLTSISSLVQVIGRGTTDEGLKEKLTLVKKQTDRITKLIRDLVTFSQPSDFQVKPTDVNNLLKESINIIKYDKRAQNCEISTSLTDKMPITEAPDDQVQQVFINILLNALDVIPPENGRIDVTSEVLDHKIRVKIKDNGKGMPPSIVDKIFDPFFTTKSVGKGTGLGLWVSYGIIESLHGNIAVETKEEAGSTFVIDIPILR